MAFKKNMHSFKGMTQDLSISKANSDYYFDAFNIRITARENNTLMSVTNEKGNVPMKDSGGNDITFEGTYLGHAVINKYLVLFTTNNGVDRIYRFLYNGSVMTTTKLFEGNLGFDIEHPIETLTDYENEDVQKVYWTDGKNQPRVINIVGEITDSNAQFDFSPTLELKEEVSITKNIGEGLYTAGTIQYLFTYLNQFGIETKPFYTSPLYYITHSDRGAIADTSVSNNFTITMNNLDLQAKYVNIYSIHRSSEGTTPEAKLVARIAPQGTPRNEYVWNIGNLYEVKVKVYDNNGFVREATINTAIGNSYQYPMSYEEATYIILTIGQTSYRINIPEGKSIVIQTCMPEDGMLRCFIPHSSSDINPSDTFSVYNGTLTYIDKGDTGESVTPTDLYYLGAENIVAQTMTDKDQTLFLGNIELKNLKPSDALKTACRELTVEWENKEGIDLADVTNTYYKYNLQLHKSSQDVKTFKYGETYRLGLQFLDANGVWSEPLWVCDSVNNVHVKYNTTGTKFELVGAAASLTNTLVNAATSLGYKKARPVVAEAGILDRTCLCQGILCPTVFNVEDRLENAPFVQSSWYARPDITKNVANITYDRDHMVNGHHNEFRHNAQLPDGNALGCEIQNSKVNTIQYSGNDFSSGLYIVNTRENAFNHNTNISNISNWVNINSHNFFVDRSVVTLHSPDLEMSESLFSIDTIQYKLRIIGVVELSGFVSDTDIHVESGPNYFYKCTYGNDYKYIWEATDYRTTGLYIETIGSYNEANNIYGANALIEYPLWIDTPMHKYTDPDENVKYAPTAGKAAYIVYPWHRSSSLNNSGVEAQESTSVLKDKQLSNLRFATYTRYIEPENLDNDDLKLDISGISLFDGVNDNIIKIPAPQNSGLSDLVYRGDYDKIIVSTNPYNIYISDDGYRSSPDASLITLGRTTTYGHQRTTIEGTSTDVDPNITPSQGSEGVRVAYKSTPHYVMAMNYTSGHAPKVLPKIGSFNNITIPTWDEDYSYYPFWKKDVTEHEADYSISQESLSPTIFGYTQAGLEANPIGYLFIGEVYNDNVQNRFGGTSDIAIQNNKWIPAGEPVDLTDSTVVKWTEGDTYFQRYDCLKTYPYSLEYTNSMTEIVSFMCETRVNIDGRTDRNRGQTNNLNMTPENFNLINEGYTQSNQFFNYKQLDDRFKLNKFPSQITWTTSKTAGALVDNWTRVTLANTLDLEGSLGEVTALEKLGDNVIAFQTDGISHIIYNPNVQINTTNGLPIEIANSGKVQGKRYLQRNVGCQNKWSIVTSDKEIYFIDNNKKSIYALSTDGSLISLTSKLGMSKWMSDNNSNQVWNPVDAENFRTYYDRGHDDVYFVNKDTCLCFSAPISQFTSFMSYNNVPAMFNIDDELFSIYGNNIWNHFKGNYNSFYGVTKPYYITVIDNDNEPYTKTYNTIEYRGDVYKWEDVEVNGEVQKRMTLQNFNTFDTVRVSNEYQDTQEVSIARTFNRPSSLSKKFRIWRISIPRDASNHRDRIVNPWVKITLKKQHPENENIELHDLAVEYFL